jgi:hypothetical protein
MICENNDGLNDECVAVRALHEMAGHKSLIVTQKHIEVNHQLLRSAVELV